MGAIIVTEKIPSFIITLGGLLVFKGVHWLVINNSTIPVVTGRRAEPVLDPRPRTTCRPAFGYVAGRGDRRLARARVVQQRQEAQGASARRRRASRRSCAGSCPAQVLAAVRRGAEPVPRRAAGAPRARRDRVRDSRCFAAPPARPLPLRDRRQRGSGARLGRAHGQGGGDRLRASWA